MGDTFSIEAEPAHLFDVPGFRAGAAACGLRSSGVDVGVLYCEEEQGVGTAVFAQSGLRGAPVLVASPRASAGRLRAVVVNAGNANCFTGEDGVRDAREVVELASAAIGIGQEQILGASHGVAGVPFPMDKVRKGIEEACKVAKEKGKGDFAAAVEAEVAGVVRASAAGSIDGKPFRIAGVAKGASASSPDMAKMFAIFVTDLAITPACLREVLIGVARRTFGHLAVDSGSGPNDTLCVLASCKAGNEQIDNVFSAGTFSDALESVAKKLASEAVRGKGALPGEVEIRVKGAANEDEASAIARSVAESTALKMALASLKPAWPLALAAAGRAAARVDETKVTVRIAGETLFDKGQVVDPVPAELEAKLGSPPIAVELDLGVGDGVSAAWGDGLPSADTQRLAAAEKQAAQARAALQKAESEFARLRDEADALNAQAKKSDDEVAGLKRELEEARSSSGEVSKAEEEVKRVTVRLQKVEDELEQTSAQLSLQQQLNKQLLEEVEKKSSKEK